MGITTQQYDKYIKKWKAEEYDLLQQLEDYSQADGSFLISSNYILQLANRAHELFIEAEPEKQRQLINLVFANLQADGERLVYKIKEPLWSVLFACKSDNWCTSQKSCRYYYQWLLSWEFDLWKNSCQRFLKSIEQ